MKTKTHGWCVQELRQIFKINIKINFQAGGLLMEIKLKTSEECPREQTRMFISAV